MGVRRRPYCEPACEELRGHESDVLIVSELGVSLGDETAGERVERAERHQVSQRRRASDELREVTKILFSLDRRALPHSEGHFACRGEQGTESSELRLRSASHVSCDDSMSQCDRTRRPMLPGSSDHGWPINAGDSLKLHE